MKGGIIIKSVLNYSVKLTVLGPLFIGSGKNLQKSEYVYDGKSIYVMDTVKLFQGLNQRKLLNRFSEGMMKSNSFDLYKFFENNRIRPSEYKQWAKYEFPCRISKNTQIAACIKDAYNMPYVPGSSLKGAIRNAVLNSLVYGSDEFSDIADKVEREEFRMRNRYLSQPAEELDARLFNTLGRDEKNRKKAVNDIFSGLRISDSKPLATNSLTLSQKLDIFPQNNPQKNTLNIHRECIMPGTVIELTAEIDTAVFPYDAQRLANFIEKTYNIQYKHFLSHFPAAENQGAGKTLLYLGGGTGFVSKTAVHSLYSDNEKRRLKVCSKILNNVDSNNRGRRVGKTGDHLNDPERYSVTPHMRKCTYYNGRRYDFGLCKVDFQPLA